MTKSLKRSRVLVATLLVLTLIISFNSKALAAGTWHSTTLDYAHTGSIKIYAGSNASFDLKVTGNSNLHFRIYVSNNSVPWRLVVSDIPADGSITTINVSGGSSGYYTFFIYPSYGSSSGETYHFYGRTS